MASERTEFRRALQKALGEQMVDENGQRFHFEGGEISGLSAQDRDVGCVWWEGKRPHAKAILEENFYRVRVFKRFKQDQGAEEPRTDRAEALEQVAEDLEAALKAVLARPWLETATGDPAGDQAFFNVLEVTTNYQSFYVEAALTAFATNRSGAGG